MANKFIVTFKQGVIAADGKQYLAACGTLSIKGDELTIGSKLHVLREDVYAVLEYDEILDGIPNSTTILAVQ